MLVGLAGELCCCGDERGRGKGGGGGDGGLAVRVLGGVGRVCAGQLGHDDAYGQAAPEGGEREGEGAAVSGDIGEFWDS